MLKLTLKQGASTAALQLTRHNNPKNWPGSRSRNTQDLGVIMFDLAIFGDLVGAWENIREHGLLIGSKYVSQHS